MREAYSTDQMLSKCCPRRLEICHDRWSRCVKFSRKQHIFLQNLCNNMKITHGKITLTFTQKILKMYFNKWIFGPKWPNLAQNWIFWPNMGVFDPFGLMAEKKKQCEQSA